MLVGETLTDAPVSEPGIQEYVEAPEAVNVVLAPEHIEAEAGVTVIVGPGLTVTVTVVS